jgi:hypothetical protein
MRRYTERDLARYELLVARARDRVVRQQLLIDTLTSLERLDAACSALDSMMETLALHEQERVRILEALSK